MALRHVYSSNETSDKASAILSLVGMVNALIIYKSVDWWQTLHQPATISLQVSICTQTCLYRVVMILGFYIFYAVTLILFTRAEILRREYRASWVKQLVTNKLAE